MASDKSMYWLAAGVWHSASALVMVTAIPQTPGSRAHSTASSEILNRVSDRADSRVDRAVYVAVSRQDCVTPALKKSWLGFKRDPPK